MISCACAAALVVTPISATIASTPSGLRDVVGMRGSSGESELQSRGWQATDKWSEASNGKYVYWWNSSKKKCVRVYTTDGRYAAIDEVGSKDCGKNDDGTAIAVAVGAAALIGAIALATSGDKDKDRYDNNRGHLYNQGYGDGYAGRRYNGSGNEYSEGYGAGMRARNGNGSYGYGGWRDLVGRSNDYADSELRNRGFLYQGKDELSSGHERMYWQPRSETCLRVRTESGNVQNIDVVRKRNCR
ncbi:hypothetical protein [Croceibacterium salegens]|nr:hypothetical protein [Croceibacterium salegens]